MPIIYLLCVTEYEECENCSDPSSVFYEDCDSYYCQQCSLLRHKHSKRIEHSIKSLKPSETNIGKHIRNIIRDPSMLGYFFIHAPNCIVFAQEST